MNNALTHPMVLPILIVLGLGTLAYILSRWMPMATKILALVAAVAVLWFAASISRLDGDAATFRRAWLTFGGGDPTAPGITLSIDLARTTLGMLVFMGAGTFGLLITIYSLAMTRGDLWEGKFYTYVIWTLAGTMIVALAGNLIVLLVGWEIVTLMLYLLINQGKGDAKAAAAKAYGMLGFADACMLLAVGLLIAAGGSDAISIMEGPRSVADFGAMGYVAYVLIMVAALAKAGAIPLHTWIPAAAKDTPTPVMALLPASLDKLMGIYLLAVLSLRMFKPDAAMQVVMMIVGALTIIVAVLMAMMQHNLKKLLSFHAVSQVGYMVLGIGTGTVAGIVGGLFHMVNHAIYKSNLFLMSGNVNEATGTDEIEKMGGLARCLPITFVCGAISAAAISGIPPFNGFVSKWLVYHGTLGVASKGLATTVLVLAVFGSALTLASFVKVMYAAFLSPTPKDASWLKKMPKESVLRTAPMIVLAIACVWLGVFPGGMVDGVLSPALPMTVSGEVPAAGVLNLPEGIWNPTQATGLILIGVVFGLVFLWVASAGKKVRVVRPFLGGEVPAETDDRWRVPGTHFYETIQKLPVLGPLMDQGEKGQLDAYEWSAKHGHSLVDLLRAQHTGLLGLYVSWCLVGLIAILIYLLLTAGV